MNYETTKRVQEHLEMIDGLRHNVGQVMIVCKEAGEEFPSAIHPFEVRGAIVTDKLNKHEKDLREQEKIVTDMLNEEQTGKTIDFPKFKSEAEKLVAIMDEAPAIDKEIISIVEDLQKLPEIKDRLEASYSLPNGTRSIQPGERTSSNVALLQRRQIVMTEPTNIIDFVSVKASSNPVKKAQMSFGMAVIDAVTKGRNLPIKCVATFTPGTAKVGGSDNATFGYLWEFSATPYNSKDPKEMISSKCFMSVNDRDLFSRVFSPNEASAPENVFREFVPDANMIPAKMPTA